MKIGAMVNRFHNGNPRWRAQAAVLGVALVGFLAGCGGSSADSDISIGDLEDADSDSDLAPETRLDVEVDPSEESEVDASEESEVDASEDTEVDASEDTEVDPFSFAAIYDEIFIPTGCVSPTCHGTSRGNLRMLSREEAYLNLVGVEAASDVCVDQEHVRVVPFEPQESLLYLKLLEDPTCGERMPDRAGLSEEHIGRIRRWIADGALDN